jgi:hypothetical protein
LEFEGKCAPQCAQQDSGEKLRNRTPGRSSVGTRWFKGMQSQGSAHPCVRSDHYHYSLHFRSRSDSDGLVTEGVASSMATVIRESPCDASQEGSHRRSIASFCPPRPELLSSQPCTARAARHRASRRSPPLAAPAIRVRSSAILRSASRVRKDLAGRSGRFRLVFVQKSSWLVHGDLDPESDGPTPPVSAALPAPPHAERNV